MGKLVYVEKATPTSAEDRRLQEQRLNKAVPVHKMGATATKSTAVGQTERLETAAEVEDALIQVLIEALSRRSPEDQDRVLQRFSDGLKVPETHLNETSGKWQGAAAPVKKSFDEAYADLMRQHDVVKARTTTGLTHLDRTRWQ